MTQPLIDEDDLAAINLALERAEDIRENIERSKIAGLDVLALETRLDADVAQLRKLKQGFFPGR